jgi:hypothetical protein
LRQVARAAPKVQAASREEVMGLQTYRITLVPLVTYVDLVIYTDPATCTVEYRGFIPGPGSVMLLANGVRFQHAVINGGTTVTPCENPPGTCKKRLEVLVVLTSIGVYFGFENIRWRTIYNVYFDTTCLPQCCS